MTEEKPLTEEELAEVESCATEERDDKTGTPINGADPGMVLRLVAEVRRLRAELANLTAPPVKGELDR